MRVLQEVRDFCSTHLAHCEEVMNRPSTVKGKKGNVEHFLLLKKELPV